MTTQMIADYLTKQLFIEGNIVTYRSLSRHFSIHVNEAKNELATYHHDAPYQSQKCAATFFLSGIPRREERKGYDEDVDMESVPNLSQEEEEDGEEVPQTKIVLVNERDLEEAKASYLEINSIHIYSISPAPIHDAGLLCAPTEFIRSTDKEKGPEFSAKLGRIVGNGIKMGTSKKKSQAVAGPSKLKMPEPKADVKIEIKESTTNAAADKGKEKPKATGKLQFFSKPKEPVKAIKKEEPAADTKKKMFFSKPAPAAKAPATAKDVASTEPAAVKVENVEPSIVKEKAAPSRGVKRKSSAGLEPKDKLLEMPAATTPGEAERNSTRVRRRVLLSDDESDTAVVKQTRRKSGVSHKTESSGNSEAEREAMALMDIDDDQVERVSRVPSTQVSSNELDDIDGDGEGASSGIQDEDASMEEEVPAKPKLKPRKPKNIIPVGRNGLKKRKVTKTRRTLDASGYMHKEDYSDWESVEEGDEPQPEPVKVKGKAKAKVAAVRKEEEEEESQEVPPPPPAKEKPKEKEPAPAKKAPAKPPTAKTKPAAKGVPVKGKQQTLNFFGPKKT